MPPALTAPCALVCSPPLVWGENHRLSLAPFATVYDGLQEHVARAQLHTLLARNSWADPVALTSGGGNGGTGAAAGWSLLPPARFLPFHIPVDVPAATARGEGVAPLCELPSEYSTALFGHVQRLARFRDEVSALRCTEEMRREVQATVHAGFKDWLQRTGTSGRSPT